MISSLTTFLTAVVVLGVWHGLLVWARGEPGWARTIIRIGILVTTAVQAAAFVIVTQLTAEVPLDKASEVLAQVATWSALADGTSLVLLAIVTVLLVGFTVRRLLRGPLPDPMPAQPPSA